MIYIIAGFFQLASLYPVVTHWDITKKFLALTFDLIGPALGLTWLLVLFCTPFLFYVGSRIIAFSTSPAKDYTIRQTDRQRSAFHEVAILLIIGILIDITFCVSSVYAQDKTAVVYVSALIGLRILAWNILAIYRYYRSQD
jgi:hypothetical protein